MSLSITDADENGYVEAVLADGSIENEWVRVQAIQVFRHPERYLAWRHTPDWKPEIVYTRRAEEIIDATMNLTLRPQKSDRGRVLAAALRATADRLYTDWAELQHPADVLYEIAKELEGECY